MKPDKSSKEQGFTIMELIVAMAISLVVMAAVFSTFKSQQDSYVVQSQVSVTQQNLRAALFIISNDIQMAGYYTNFMSSSYPFQSSDPVIDNATIRPVIYALNDDNSLADVKDNTDILVIIKGSDKIPPRTLTSGEYSTPGEASTADLVFNNHANALDDLDLHYISASENNKYGLLVKKDMNRAELFEVTSGDNLIFPSGLTESYTEGDFVVKVDVIIYKIEDTASGPTLKRKNLGTDADYNIIAEDVDDLQLSYILADGSEDDAFTDLSNIPKVRAVKADIIARTDNKIRGYTGDEGDGYMRRSLSTTITARNIGL